MTVRRMATAMLLLTIASAFLLVFASHLRYRFYENLMRQAEAVISQTSSLALSDFADRLVPSDDSTPGTNLARVRVLSSDGHPKAIRHLAGSALIALDNLNEGGRLVRRDIFHGGVRRVSVFYDDARNPFARTYYDQAGEIIDNRTFFVPFPSPWPIYGL